MQIEHAALCVRMSQLATGGSKRSLQNSIDTLARPLGTLSCTGSPLIHYAVEVQSQVTLHFPNSMEAPLQLKTLYIHEVRRSEQGG